MAKFLRVIGITIIVIIIIPLIAGFFIRKDYEVERSIEIDRHRDTVFNYLVMLKNQDDYSVWSSMDTSMKHTYTGVDGTVGFISAWESAGKTLGKGEQEIVAIQPGERIDYKLRFIKPFKAESDVYLITEHSGEGKTLIRWGISGRMNYPFNVMLLFMNMNESLGEDFSKGLEHLKNIIEK